MPQIHIAHLLTFYKAHGGGHPPGTEMHVNIMCAKYYPPSLSLVSVSLICQPPPPFLWSLWISRTWYLVTRICKILNYVLPCTHIDLYILTNIFDVSGSLIRNCLPQKMKTYCT